MHYKTTFKQFYTTKSSLVFGMFKIDTLLVHMTNILKPFENGQPFQEYHKCYSLVELRVRNALPSRLVV